MKILPPISGWRAVALQASLPMRPMPRPAPRTAKPAARPAPRPLPQLAVPQRASGCHPERMPSLGRRAAGRKGRKRPSLRSWSLESSSPWIGALCAFKVSQSSLNGSDRKKLDHFGVIRRRRRVVSVRAGKCLPRVHALRRALSWWLIRLMKTAVRNMKMKA